MTIFARMKRFQLLALLLISALCSAQNKFGGAASFDKVVHNFGEVLLSDGPLSCSFTVTNISDKPIAIYSVVSSCGCTDVKWTKAPIASGKTGTISATYSNDEGPYPFEKTLSAYISGLSTPVILRLRGVSTKKPEPLEKAYPVHLGSLGFKETTVKVGNMEQGSSVSEEILIANLLPKRVKVEFADIDPLLSLKFSPNPMERRQTSALKFSVKADRSKWGKNEYKASVLVDGKKVGVLTFWAVTKENFGTMTKAQKEAASRPMFEQSTVSFGKVKAGAKIEGTFSLSNKGKSPFEVYKVDCDKEGLSAGAFPSVAPGAKGEWKVSFDTSGLPSGEALVIISLVTNSPSRPLVNLFLTGWIE